MVDIVLDSPELTVLGGPSEINVELNVGRRGERGVYIFTGLVRPEDPLATFSEAPNLFDLYLIINPASDDYLRMFQYINEDGVLTWVEVIQLTLNVYNTGRTVTFVNGVGEAQIDVFELGFGKNVPLPSLVDSRFFINVIATPENTNPTSLAVEINDLQSISAEGSLTDSITYIPLTFHAAEFVEGVWQEINGPRIINMTITLKNPADLQLGLIDEGS